MGRRGEAVDKDQRIKELERMVETLRACVDSLTKALAMASTTVYTPQVIPTTPWAPSPWVGPDIQCEPQPYFNKATMTGI